MFVRTWFDALASRPSRPQNRHSKYAADRRLAARRLLLEGLEDRRLMAFNVLSEMPTGFGSQLVELASIDSDGQLDLVTIESGKVAIRLGNADGSFGDPLAATGAIVANSAITGDFTDDGVTDLVTSYRSPNSDVSQISLRIGNGDGSFGDPLPLEVPFQRESAITGSALYGQTLGSLATGDLNDDGKLDLVLGGSTSFPIGIGYYGGYYNTYHGYINVLLGTGAGSFDYVDADDADPNGDPNAYPLGDYQFANSLAIDDLDNDGQRDVVVAKSGGMAALLGDGTGAFQNPVHSGSGEGFSSVSLGDLDGDGNLDTVTKNGNSLIVQKGQGDGTFAQGAVLDAGQTLRSAVIGDVDGDGNLDLVAGGNVSRPYYWYYGYDPANIKQASVLLGDGQGGFSLPIASSLGTIPDISSSLNKLVLADLTGDGLLDLVAVDYVATEGAIIAANDGNWGAPGELAITDATVAEGDGGSASAVFTVSLIGNPGEPVTVDFVVFDYFDFGDNTAAQAGEDYTPLSGTLTFAPGVLSQTITVPIFGDRLGEGNETFLVNLSNPAGALVRDAEGVGTIVDNEPDISIDHAYGIDALTVVEGDSGTTPAVFTMTLSQPYDQDVTVDYFASTGHTSDIVAASGTLRFAAGQITKTITVQVVGDLLDEELEAFNVYLTNPSANASIAASAGYCYIEDNDPTPTVSIGDVSKTEGNSGTTKFNFTLTLSSPTANGGYVEFATANGTATTANQDYVAKSGYVYFESGATTATISIDVKGDTATEADETFFVNLLGAGGAAIVDSQGAGSILNDDNGNAAPTISIGDASVVEGNSGSKSMTFTVSLSQPSSKSVRVNYKTANVTAKTSDNDYVSKSGTITFSPGQTTKTITITIKGDKKREQDESFKVNLSSAINGEISDGQALGTILNDDGGLTGGSWNSHAAAIDAAIEAFFNSHPKLRRR